MAPTPGTTASGMPYILAKGIDQRCHFHIASRMDQKQDPHLQSQEA